MTDKNRREFLQGLGAASIALPFISPNTLPGIDTSPSNASPFLRDQFGARGLSPAEELKTYSNDRIAVHVPYEDDAKESLEEWVDASADRDILRENDAIRTLTIRLPADEVGGQLLGNGALESLDYLDPDEQLDVNIELSIPEPVDLDEEPDELLSFSGMASTILSVFGWSDIATNEVAYDDAEPGTVREAAQHTGAPDALVDSADTSTLTIAVIDTGFNTADGDILGDTNRILDASTDYTEPDDPTVAEDGLDAVADGNGHGTHVASTIAANPPDAAHDDYRGYAPDADLLILRALDDDGSGSTADISRAITDAADEGADLICMSLGSPIWSVELERSLAYAVGAGSIPVVAGGNNRSTPQPFVNSPGDGAYAITVAAGEVRPAEETRGGHFSAVAPDPGTVNFSDGETEGAGPDIAAPGVELTALTADTTGSLDEETLSGTSMAAPCVVGGLALVQAESNVEEFEEMEERLAEYAEPAPKLGIHEAGAGWLDVEATIEETEPDETQADARTDEAQARDESWDALSSAYGSDVARYFL